MSHYLDLIVSLATMAGVIIAAVQLRASSKIAQAQYEDSIDQQYRDLARGIPVDALIGKEVQAQDKSLTRELIYNYLDLSNEQIFLRKKNRVKFDTWSDWCAGIKANLAKPEFAKVWNEVKQESPQTFTFLEKLEAQQYNGDPLKW